MTDLDATAAAPQDGAEQLELASIHDFASKLTLPGSIDALAHYVRWQVALRSGSDPQADANFDPTKVPDFAPLSIKLGPDNGLQLPVRSLC